MKSVWVPNIPIFDRRSWICKNRTAAPPRHIDYQIRRSQISRTKRLGQLTFGGKPALSKRGERRRWNLAERYQAGARCVDYVRCQVFRNRFSHLTPASISDTQKQNLCATWHTALSGPATGRNRMTRISAWLNWNRK